MNAQSIPTTITTAVTSKILSGLASSSCGAFMPKTGADVKDKERMTALAKPDDNPYMDEKPTKRERGGAAVVMVLVALLVVLPLFYVLSIGPVAGMLDAGWIPRRCEPTLEVVYSPLIWTANNVPTVESVFTSYIHLWVTPNEAVYTATPTAVVPPPTPAPSGS